MPRQFGMYQKSKAIKYCKIMKLSPGENAEREACLRCDIVPTYPRQKFHVVYYVVKLRKSTT